MWNEKCKFAESIRVPEEPVKRESGENPEQSRCCELQIEIAVDEMPFACKWEKNGGAAMNREKLLWMRCHCAEDGAWEGAAAMK